MHWGKRGPGSLSKRRREAFQPGHEPLENRRLLATFDLTGTQVQPYGVEMIGKSASDGAGTTVTDIGDFTGSGYDSFVVSAPNKTTGSAAYIVFGSKQVNVSSPADFLKLAKGVLTNGQLSSGQRAGDLGQLGTLGTAPATGQINPTVLQPTTAGALPTLGFNYDGLTLVTTLNSATSTSSRSGLGFAVAALGDVNNDGVDDFAISAPSDSGGGRVFVVFGNKNLSSLATTSKTIDLEPTVGSVNTTSVLKILSLFDSNASSATLDQFGASIAGIGNYFQNNSGFPEKDLGIGVPGLNGGVGAAFVVSGAFLVNPTNANIDVGTITNGTAAGNVGIEYTGVNPGGRVGASISSAGNFDGQSGTNGQKADSLLIGSPATGLVYLVYSIQDHTQNATINSVQSLLTLGNTPTTNPINFPLQGVVFQGPSGANFGFSLASAVDFNGDNASGSGAQDIMIGAPGYFSTTGSGTLPNGFVDVFFGVKGTATGTPARLNTNQQIITPTAVSTGSVAFIGQANDQAGYSIAPSGHINLGSTGTQPLFDELIGAPGNSVAYLVPGTPAGGTALTGMQLLSAISTTLKGNQFTATGTGTFVPANDPAVNVSGFGLSVSARNPLIDPNTLNTTLDNDAVPDLFFGAPGTSLLNPASPTTTLRAGAGIAYAIQGGLIGGTSTNNGGNTSQGSINSLLPNAFSILAPIIFTGNDYGLTSPPVSTLEHLTSYQPIPVQLAFQQYRLQPGFETRQQVYHHPSQGKTAHQAAAGTILNVAAIGKSENQYSKKNTLPSSVFTRGGKLSRPDQSVTFTHKVKVIPRAQQTQTFNS